MEKYILGKKSVIEAFKSNRLKALYTKVVFPEVSDIKKKNIPVYFGNNKIFGTFNNVNHQNVIGVVDSKEKLFIEDIQEFLEIANNVSSKLTNKKIVLVLDEIQDAGNFGSIMRTSFGLGVKNLIFKKDNQVQINETVMKTSMGSYEQLNLLRVTNLSNTIEKLKDNGYWIVSSALNDDSIDISKQKLNFDKVAIIFGNENNGVSPNLLKKSDAIIKIPMEDNSVQSFNVSVSVGIILFYLLF
ncbi:23S rRNA (guanosine(2251)-2'-O)-methyltransferase RlmB [Malacoplasma iowae]|uniref:rRNA methylase, SpoU class n=1 Tax=Malacoplasma iowae DK-CPA TaxID=1394179 RepID=A0A084U4T2_MALIO|nr:23S rRNA (guanosine(2251)-2'-O)-methyltransferase RlmB [Malacoplasma iowae]KFB07968.1 rRNA methylase, SpoU class [Malacoplasma iowae DK-CPA]WPL37261.1 23S rRNA (guanosine(2251)-2'-O)-methyltransferase RlmB [Malacoplasma iowae]WPL37619.1 23S rRNA (guanosine(2251)-2'-O)-methyltransferase RlmB [Malacoplasma iowae]WPL40825.1 23S rRNA (guanosine(2251)-2'-O)-methyltransferase RlmB [Malacoplasma iowae]